MARHIETVKPKAGKSSSHRKKTNVYHLTNHGKCLQVCKNTFLATLGIEEKFAQVVLEKIRDTGILDEDKRGGKQSKQIWVTEEQQKEKISQHTDRFPYVESHFCFASSSKEYL